MCAISGVGIRWGWGLGVDLAVSCVCRDHGNCSSAPLERKNKSLVIIISRIQNVCNESNFDEFGVNNR